MGREVRMVPENWVHPRDKNGNYQPMFDRDYKIELKEWLKEKKRWDDGFQKNWTTNEYKPKDEEYKNMPFEEYHGCAPDSRYYMPVWKKEERTHYMMYESITEGTPKSPAFKTPEELARWLTDNYISVFEHMALSYEEWLRMIKPIGEIK